LYKRSGNDVLRRTALGAANATLPDAGRLQYARNGGLYGGWSGVAVALARVGSAINEPKLIDRANQLAQKTLVAHAGEGDDFDIVAGHAGDLVAALALYRDLHRIEYLESAVALGERMLHTAVRDEAGASWVAPEFPESRSLTGLSHGASGAGWALLELWSSTGDDRFRDCAYDAFAYERHWFDGTRGNWPDFRSEGRGRHNTASRRFCVFWCHGAPGIALARKRAYELTGDSVFQEEAIIALETTRQEASSYLDSGIGNFSLCHGLAGLADVLMCAHPGGVAGSSSDVELIRRILQIGCDRYAEAHIPWPCGTHSSETPGALLGLAGIGSLYLRAYDPDAISFLTILY